MMYDSNTVASATLTQWKENVEKQYEIQEINKRPNE